MPKTDLTHEILKATIDYNPETGLFSDRNGRKMGGLNHLGYVRIKIRYKKYFAHRLAWLWVYGEWPLSEIDHINGHRADNRICNLRICNRSQNMANSIHVRTNSSIRKGVCWNKKLQRYRAYIGNRHLGLFSSAEEAVAARVKAEQSYYGEFAR